MDRTQLQKDADSLDMDMYHTARSMEAFADQTKSSHVLAAARALLHARSHVRAFMHETDREATKG